MTSKDKVSKRQAIDLDKLSIEILRLWRTTESPYRLAVNKLSEAKVILRSNPTKALSLMDSAYRMMQKEAEAATIYNRYRLLIPQIQDKGVNELDSQYKKCLNEGKYDDAKHIAEKISLSDATLKADHSLSLLLDEVNESSVTFILKNGSNRDVIVKRLAISVDQQRLNSDTVYPFVIHKATQMPIKFNRSGIKGDVAKSTLEYSEDDITKTSFSEFLLE